MSRTATAPRRNPSECGPPARTKVRRYHPFVPTGTTKLYVCVAWACATGGLHEPCAVCAAPRDEHPYRRGRR